MNITKRGMAIISKREVYEVVIREGDTHFSQYKMDNRSYARINGKWHFNTGGGVLNWRGSNEKESTLLEAEFIRINRQERLDKLLDI
jgi:hypothetical protein